jgi:hypothetical protein
VLETLEEGALLRVYEESVGFYEVARPEGFPVWVYGQYLAPTQVEGVLSVTGNGVRMRPLPSSEVSSFPISAKLQIGDRVRLLERANPSLPLGEDWVRVQSPPRARGWVRTGQVVGEPDLAAARGQWQSSLIVLPSAPKPAPSPAAQPRQADAERQTPTTTAAGGAAAGAAASGAVPDEAHRSLRYGESLLDAAIKKGETASSTDFDKPIHAFEVVMELAPADSVVYEEAARRRKEAQAYQQIAAVREGLKAADVQRAELRRELERERAREELKDTAHWGRFMGRGNVESRKIRGETRWFLRWGGAVTFEITCQSGRYDLAVFEGCEIGVKGSTLRSATLATDDAEAQVALLDVTRVEVISGGVPR